jgi:hypothetical protein
MRYWILLIPALSFAEINTTGNLIVNPGFDDGTNGWTLLGDAQRMNDCCPGGHDLEFGPSGSIEQSFNLISNSITQPMLDNGITLNSSVEVQNGECGVAQCWGGAGPADPFSIRLQIRDENDEVLATTTQERYNVTGINGKDFTNSISYAGVGSNIGNINISGGDSANRRLGGPNIDNVSVTMTYDDTVLSLEQTQILTSAFEEIEEVTAEIELVEIEPLTEIVFEIFEEPELEISMIEEITLEEFAIQEINTGVVNVFQNVEIETLTEIPMEVSYGNQESIEEIAAEIQIEEEVVEIGESSNIETATETAQGGQESIASSGEELVGGNESESGESETGVPEESTVANREQPTEQVVEETETSPESTETETLVASEEVEDETVGETETSESNEGDETTEVADASGENDQSTSEAIEEGGSRETSTRNATVVSIESIQKKVNETLKRVDQRLIATSILAAKAMQSKVSVEDYGNTNSDIFDSQPQIDGGNYYETRQYIDARNLYAQNQNVYADPVTKYQEKLQDKIDARIRAEEHLRRIRGF